jgi:hypothetical protein
MSGDTTHMTLRDLLLSMIPSSRRNRPLLLRFNMHQEAPVITMTPNAILWTE